MLPEALSLPLKAVPLGKVASPQAMTEGVIIGSAAFCESAALRGKVFADFQRAKLPQSKPDGFASSLGEGAFGAPGNFPTAAEAFTHRGKP